MSVLEIITCEYPPDLGGIADYTQQVARGLARRGWHVRIWTKKSSRQQSYFDGALVVQPSFASFGVFDLWRLQKLWNRDPPRRKIFLQWTPTGYRFRAMNMWLPIWLALRSISGDTVAVMFHEGFYGFEEPKLRNKVVAVIQRVMAATLVNTADQVFVSTPFLLAQLSRLKLRNIPIMQWLPIPSNVVSCTEITEPPPTTSGIRVGHFGTFNPNFVSFLIPVIRQLLKLGPEVEILLIGAGSQQYLDLIGDKPSNQITATGVLSSKAIADAIGRCTFMFQPFPEGLSTRRTTAMAALACGKLLVSTKGRMTESIWDTTTAVRFLESGNPSLAAAQLYDLGHRLNDGQSEEIRQLAIQFYETNFSISRVLDVLSTFYRQ